MENRQHLTRDGACRRPDAGGGQRTAAFFVFRFFDIVKPWPGGAFEKLPSGWGVVLDDVMGGIYGALVLWAAIYFLG